MNIYPEASVQSLQNLAFSDPPSLRVRLVFPQRPITKLSNGLRIEVEIQSLPANILVKRAPRSSKRHVASADCARIEDFNTFLGFDVEESIKREDGNRKATTINRLREA